MPRGVSHNFRFSGASAPRWQASKFRSAASTAFGFSGAAVTINKPAGTVDGDIMVAVLCSIDGAVPNSVPAGWTLIGSTSVPTENNSMHAYQKTASSEGASYIWGTNNVQHGAILTYTGVTGITTISRADSTTANTASVPASTNANAKAQVIYAGRGRWFSAGSSGPVFLQQPQDGSGATSRALIQDGVTVNNREFMHVYDAQQNPGLNFPAYTAAAVDTLGGGAIRAGFLRFTVCKAP